jgi:hypothetical protein
MLLWLCQTHLRRLLRDVQQKSTVQYFQTFFEPFKYCFRILKKKGLHVAGATKIHILFNTLFFIYFMSYCTVIESSSILFLHNQVGGSRHYIITPEHIYDKIWQATYGSIVLFWAPLLNYTFNCRYDPANKIAMIRSK